MKISDVVDAMERNMLDECVERENELKIGTRVVTNDGGVHEIVQVKRCIATPEQCPLRCQKHKRYFLENGRITCISDPNPLGIKLIYRPKVAKGTK